MLVLIFGVSGVGKSKLISELTVTYGWRSIPTYMTRPLRQDEAEKISITRRQFDDMTTNGCFLTVNELFDQLYGTPLREVADAVKDTQINWILDFPLSKRNVFSEYPHACVIVLPESIQQLIKQVHDSGRSERLAAILDDYDRHYAQYEYSASQDVNTFTVINFAGRAAQVAATIHSRFRR